MDKVTITEAGNLLSVSVDTMRRWEKKGLIKSTRAENNFRLFDVAEIRRLIKKQSSSEYKSKFKTLKTKNKSDYTVLELFAGAGGTSLGFENAGLQHIAMIEKDRNAVQTLRNNFKHCQIIEGDVANIDFSVYSPDIVQGGFPCQSFSYAGNSLGFDDIRGTMFFEFARCVKETKPKIAVGENVRGLIKHDGGRTLNTMVTVLRDLGYRVHTKLLRSQYLDVPQKRERLIILAIRNDLDIPFVFPKERDYIITLRESIGDKPDSVWPEYSKRKKYIMSLVPEGGYWKDLPVELQKEYMQASYYRTGGRTGMARRLTWSEPSLTLTCNPAQKHTERCHPEETRPLSVKEYARIQTFPDNWIFAGSMSSKYHQIGNAVPVNLAYHIGKCLIAMLDNNYNNMEVIRPDEIREQLTFGF